MVSVSPPVDNGTMERPSNGNLLSLLQKSIIIAIVIINVNRFLLTFLFYFGKKILT